MCCWREHWRFLKTLKTSVTIWSSNPTPGYVTRKGQNCNSKGSYTSLFLAALITIAKTWKQSKCPSPDEWTKKIWCMWYTYNEILLGHKREWNIVICSNMDGPRDYYTEWSQIEKHKHYMISHIWNLKNNTNKLIYKTDSQTLKKNLWLPEGKEVGGKIT